MYMFAFRGLLAKMELMFGQAEKPCRMRVFD
jgi:hypothetical protein